MTTTIRGAQFYNAAPSQSDNFVRHSLDTSAGVTSVRPQGNQHSIGIGDQRAVRTPYFLTQRERFAADAHGLAATHEHILIEALSSEATVDAGQDQTQLVPFHKPNIDGILDARLLEQSEHSDVVEMSEHVDMPNADAHRRLVPEVRGSPFRRGGM